MRATQVPGHAIPRHATPCPALLYPIVQQGRGQPLGASIRSRICILVSCPVLVARILAEASGKCWSGKYLRIDDDPSSCRSSHSRLPLHATLQGECTMFPFPASTTQSRPPKRSERSLSAALPWAPRPSRGSQMAIMARPSQSLKSILIALSTPGDPNHSLLLPSCCHADSIRSPFGETFAGIFGIRFFLLRQKRLDIRRRIFLGPHFCCFEEQRKRETPGRLLIHSQVTRKQRPQHQPQPHPGTYTTLLHSFVLFFTPSLSPSFTT